MHDRFRADDKRPSGQSSMANSSAWAAMSGLNGHAAILLIPSDAGLAQSAERKALNLVIVGSSPTVGATANECASAGNRTRVTSMATMYSTTRPLMLLMSAAYMYAT